MADFPKSDLVFVEFRKPAHSADPSASPLRLCAGASSIEIANLGQDEQLSEETDQWDRQAFA